MLLISDLEIEGYPDSDLRLEAAMSIINPKEKEAWVVIYKIEIKDHIVEYLKKDYPSFWGSSNLFSILAEEVKRYSAIFL